MQRYRTAQNGLLFIFLIWILWSAKVLAQPIRFDRFTVEEGLSHNTVTALHLDQRGFLWVGTINGLNRYDGASFRTYRFDPNDSTSLSNDFIHGVYEDQEGELWISTRDGGVSRYDATSDLFRRYLPNSGPDPLPPAPVNLVYQDPDGRYWLGFFEGSFGLFDPERGRYFPNTLIDANTGERLTSPNAMLVFRDGSALVTLFEQVAYIPSASFQSIGYHKAEIEAHLLDLPFALDGINVVGSFLGPDGSLWINRSDRLRKLPEASYPSGMGSSVSSGVAYQTNRPEFRIIGSKAYSGGPNGSLLETNLTNNSRRQITPPDLDIDGQSRLYVDRHNDWWLQTWGGGFFRIHRREGIRTVNRKQHGADLPSDFMLAFEEEPDLGLWIGTSAGLALRRDEDGAITTWNSFSIWDLERTDHGLWVATRSSGLHFYPNRSIAFGPRSGSGVDASLTFTRENSFLAGNDIMSVLEDRRGWLWIGTPGEVYLIRNPNRLVAGEPANVTQLPDASRELTLSSASVRTFYEDREGDIWIATTNGGFNRLKIQDGTITQIEPFTHSRDRPSITHNDARSVYHQNDSTYWFVTYGGGLVRWRTTGNGNRFTPITTQQGLPNNSCYSILPESNNRYLWTSTNFGLARIDTETLEITSFTENDGLQNNEFNTGAYLKRTSGELVFGGINGFNQIIPSSLSDNPDPPPVYLTDIKLFNRSMQLDSSAVVKQTLKLPHDHNFLSFEIAALNFESPEENRFAYRMNGIDQDWVYSGSRNFANYPNLEPGRYLFEAKGANNSGVWSEQMATLRITITPPWWETLWFRILAIVGITGGLIGLVRYYSQKQLREELRQMEIRNRLKEERERISRDLHDHVGAQLTNITSGLSLADKYSEAENRERTQELLKLLQDDAKTTIKQLRETIWALNQETLTLAHFRDHLQRYFSQQERYFEGVEVSLSIADHQLALSPSQALNLFRIIQEAAQNSLKYSGGNHISVDLRVDGPTLTVIVSDNGSFKGKSSGDHYGIGNMRKRARELNGSLVLSTDSGTTVTVRLPIAPGR